ncbi:hypothetical protein BGZ65_011192 [Modicella reniformis]|uniref:Crinkler effector protein N-terminal domain-containing protein n=1 Tax=Modicella reniformis TaxID=1440133 RepID=A0A9P6MDG5_9FUNG|nr:hypothetical protein BGZ65_011192 [Modicella reniformis]
MANTLTLFCVVEGESSVFPVDITGDRTVSHLKNAIKTEVTPKFDDIAADKLILWKVSVPITDDVDEVPIKLDALDEKKILGAATELSEVKINLDTREIDAFRTAYLDAVNGLGQKGVIVVIPFVLLKKLNLMLAEHVIPDHLLIIPTKERSWRWKDFEILVGHYQKAMINALIDVRDTNLALAKNKISVLQTQVAAANASEDVSKAVSVYAGNRKAKRPSRASKQAGARTWTLSEVFRGAKGKRVSS